MVECTGMVAMEIQVEMLALVGKIGLLGILILDLVIWRQVWTKTRGEQFQCIDGNWNHGSILDEIKKNCIGNVYASSLIIFHDGDIYDEQNIKWIAYNKRFWENLTAYLEIVIEHIKYLGINSYLNE